jgi:uncharacterized glyoxalase superfamily protein PhnB
MDNLENLAAGVHSFRPVVPAKDFDRSLKFYSELGFKSKPLTHGLAEMTLGVCSFLLQDYYVQQWADNSVIHMFVTDVHQWWHHIRTLDLQARYGIKATAPKLESWGAETAGVVDPSGVLWRIHQVRDY